MAGAAALSSLNTQLLFRALLRPLRIDTVCDVGSMDGTESRAFRARLPAARILALEANPQNFRRMSSDARLDAARVELIEAAAAGFDGHAPFYVVGADFDSPDIRRGHSSLRRRDAPHGPLQEIHVRTVRLDSLLSVDASDRLALWIDVEGLALEVLEGARGILARTQLLHVELESVPCISEGQRLAPEVIALLTAAGFDEIATDHPPSTPQFNAVFLRRGQDAATLRRVRAALSWGLMRRRFATVAARLTPRLLHRLQDWRAARSPT